MTEEKILALHNMYYGKKVDRFGTQILIWLDVMFSVIDLVVLMTVSYKNFSNGQKILIIMLFLFCDFLLFIWSMVIKNPAYEYPIIALATFSTTIKGYITYGILSPWFYEEMKVQFNVVHILFLIASFFVSFIMVRERVIGVKYLLNHSAKETRAYLSSRKINRYTWMGSAPALAGALYWMFRDSAERILPYVLWMFPTVWLILTSISFHSLYTSIRYDLYGIMKRGEKL